MIRQTLKDARFHTIGFIDTATNGKQTAKDAAYKPSAITIPALTSRETSTSTRLVVATCCQHSFPAADGIKHPTFQRPLSLNSWCDHRAKHAGIDLDDSEDLISRVVAIYDGSKRVSGQVRTALTSEFVNLCDK